jgi:hypothetical protein
MVWTTAGFAVGAGVAVTTTCFSCTTVSTFGVPATWTTRVTSTCLRFGHKFGGA